jgi:hypothetical protein
MGLINKQTRAIVILYNGSEVNKETLVSIAHLIDADVDAGNTLDVRLVDSDDIAKILFKHGISDVKVNKESAKDQAIIYIASLFLREMPDPAWFRKSLIVNAISGNNAELLNALTILKDGIDGCSANILNKYGIKPPHVRAIKTAANLIL